MKTYKTIIIEDEQPATELIQAYLSDHPFIEVIKTCSDGFSGLKAIQEHQPDLIFLDVQMPKLTGFEMLELLEQPPVIIFTTAFDEFAIKAFEMNAVDYLLKPFSRDRFAQALKKAVEKIELQNSEPTTKSNISNIHDTLIQDQILERIVVKKKNNIILIPASEITHIEAYDDYVIVHFGGNKYLKQKTMKYYEEHLDNNKFIRIHRSWIVNIECIDQIMLWEKDTYMVKLKSGEELRASRSGYKRLKEIF
jgi:two-component system, LytTR family, response regulator